MSQVANAQAPRLAAGKAQPKAKDNTRAASVVAAFLSSTDAVDAANSQLVAAKNGMLSSLRAALKGCAAVTADAWAKEWAEPVLKALLASGRYTVDDKGKSLSATVQASNLKIAVIAITNGVEPEGEPATSLKAFVSRVRPELVSDDLIEASGAGAKRKGGERKSNAREAAFAQACFLVSGRDRARAKVLSLIMQEYADAFDDWADGFIVEMDNKARKGARRR